VVSVFKVRKQESGRGWWIHLLVIWPVLHIADSESDCCVQSFSSLAFFIHLQKKSEDDYDKRRSGRRGRRHRSGDALFPASDGASP